MAITIKLRNDTTANWEYYNPVLAKGEIGLATDSLKFKFGNGVSQWKDLAYAKASTNVDNIENKINEILAKHTIYDNDISQINADLSTVEQSIDTLRADIITGENSMSSVITGYYTALLDNYVSANINVRAVSSDILELSAFIDGEVKLISTFDDRIKTNTNYIDEISSKITNSANFTYATVSALNEVSTAVLNHSEYIEKLYSDVAANTTNIVNLQQTKLDASIYVSEISTLSSELSTEISNKANKDGIEDFVKSIVDDSVSAITTNITTLSAELDNKSDIEHTHSTDKIYYNGTPTTTTITNIIDIIDDTVKFGIYNNISDKGSINAIIDVSSNIPVIAVKTVNNNAISSELSVNPDSIVYSEYSSETSNIPETVNVYSFSNTENKIAKISDILPVVSNNAVKGNNIEIKQPEWNEANGHWLIKQANADNNDTQIKIKQDQTDNGSYQCTELISKKAVENIQDNLQTEIDDINSILEVTVANAGNWEIVNENILIYPSSYDAASSVSSDIYYIYYNITNVLSDSSLIKDNIEIPTEVIDEAYYQFKQLTVKLSSGYVNNNPTNYKICAAVYLQTTYKNTQGNDVKRLTKLFESLESFVFEQGKEYTYTFASASTVKIKLNDNSQKIYIGFVVVNTNEQTYINVDNIRTVENGNNNIGLVYEQSFSNETNINKYSTNIYVYGNIVNDNFVVIKDYVNTISAELEVDIDNLSNNIYTELEEVSSTLSEEMVALSESAKLTEDITVTGVSNVGALKNGDTLSAGTTLTNILKTMLQVELEAIRKYPTISQLSGTRGSGYVKVGTDITTGWTIGVNYTDGTYTIDPNVESSTINAGTSVLGYTYSYPDGTAGEETTTINTETNATTYEFSANAGNINNMPEKVLTYSIFAKHSDGAPVTSNTGIVHDEWKIDGGNTNTYMVRFTGYRPFYKNYLSEQLDASSINSTYVTNTIGNSSTIPINNVKEITLEINPNSKGVAFAYPSASNKTPVSVIDTGALGADIITSFNSVHCTVSSENNYDTADYIVYYINYSVPNEKQNTYIVKLS